MRQNSVSEFSSRITYKFVLMLSLCHLINDSIQSLIPAIHPIVKEEFSLNFTQIGIITLVFQFSSSLLQPVVGFIIDRKHYPYLFPIGMLISLTGIILLAICSSYVLLLVAVATVGAGSAIFHPEASRIAYICSKNKRGLTQSIFQLGGNFGSALGPILAALLVASYGRLNVFWMSPVALIAVVIMFYISKWFNTKSIENRRNSKKSTGNASNQCIQRKTIVLSITILLILIFSKYFYSSSISSYYTFYLINKFGVSIQQSQWYLFIYLLAVALGTMIGGPLGDKIGRKYVIWISILGASPFALALPYANLPCTVVLTFIIGMIIASAFSAILLYAQELLPQNIGMISGLFFGLSFGMGGIGSAVIGAIADSHGIDYIYRICSYLPLVGLVAVFLPTTKKL
ncbi:FSR family fosmidomycin resistance protein-like MFS transporter [Sphingobacterium zeae]|uniref:FSR family fosmidomycin resistance protein-like MFS transporter n=1 Tax=Sphingobacterium zeae TaxID=1776859 RepID=A0ABU0U5N1_9SPHI|nr:MFS transporter [Sphingobacterium zeae]MDQ1150250.1 FSR family fosmidomycin resistance protein-like MFS transporter [Sphingobacterium zeae]